MENSTKVADLEPCGRVRFNGRDWPLMLVGGWKVAPVELERQLVPDGERFVSEEAESIDDGIGYYFEPSETVGEVMEAWLE